MGEQLLRKEYTVDCTVQTAQTVIPSVAGHRIRLKYLRTEKRTSVGPKNVKFRWSITDTVAFLPTDLVDANGSRQDLEVSLGEDELVGPAGAAMQITVTDGAANASNDIFVSAFYKMIPG